MHLPTLILSSLLLLLGRGWAQTPAPKYPNYPSKMPAEFKTVTDSFD